MVKLSVVVLSSLLASYGLGQEITIDVNESRPLSEASVQVTRLLGIPIYYEDGPLASEDMQDITEALNARRTQEQRARIGSARTLVPRGGQLTVTFTAKPTSRAEATAMVNRLIRANQDAGFTGPFVADFANGGFYITAPRNSRSTVLDYPVTLAAASRSLYATLNEIVRQVSQGTGVGMGIDGALMSLGNTRTTIGAVAEPARNVIARLLTTTGQEARLQDGTIFSPYGYQLRYDANLKYYGLTIVPVGAPLVPQTPAPENRGRTNPYSRAVPKR